MKAVLFIILYLKNIPAKLNLLRIKMIQHKENFGVLSIGLQSPLSQNAIDLEQNMSDTKWFCHPDACVLKSKRPDECSVLIFDMYVLSS